MVRAGYAYERYVFSDAQYNYYQYYNGTASGMGAILTGANPNPSYSANIVFAGLTYKFK